MSLTQDGYAANSAGGTQTAATVTLTTTKTNNIILLAVFNESFGNGTGPQTISGVTGGGLTWAKRAGVTFTANNGSDLELWWAKAVSPLSAQVLTATFISTTDDWSAWAMGVNGADLVTPWDTNVSLPATNSSNAAAHASVSGVSTTLANTMLITAMGGPQFFDTGSAPTGWTAAGTPSNTAGGHVSASCFGAFNVVSATQSGITVAEPDVTESNWGIIADAIRQSSSAPPILRNSIVMIG